MRLIRKYHNHKLQTNQCHRNEEPHNNQSFYQTALSHSSIIPLCYFLFQVKICLQTVLALPDVLLEDEDDSITDANNNIILSSPLEGSSLYTGYGYLRFYPGIENLILPMLPYPERQITSSCEIAS